MANAERLRTILDHIKTLPTSEQVNDPTVPRWNQSKWIEIPAVPLTDTEGQPMIEGSCGTAGCFAGWAVMLFTPEFKLTYAPWDNMIYNVQLPGEEYPTPIDALARQHLDLNYVEGDVLFHQDNTIEDLERIIGEILEGKYPDIDEDED